MISIRGRPCRLPTQNIIRMLIRHVRKKYIWFMFFFLINVCTFSYLLVRNFQPKTANANAIPVAIIDPSQKPSRYLLDLDISNTAGSRGGAGNPQEINVVPPGRKIAGKEEQTNENGPIVTLFTTMKLNSEREMINKNTLKLWASMRPWAKLVLFTTPKDDKKWGQYAQELGWNVYPAPKLRRGVPVLRDMFTFICNSITPPTPFLGYANSDILFTADLNTTLTALQKLQWDRVGGKGALLIGRRTDTSAEDATLVNSYTALNTYQFTKGAEPSSGYMLDYFITTPNGFPWHKVPDFVVGKPGYDNWLIIKALDWKLKLLDLTLSVTALHQMYSMENTDSGWYSKNVCMNRELFDPFSVVRGHSDCAPYFTKRLDCGTVIVYKRTTEIFNCLPEVPIWGSPRHIDCVDIVAKLKNEGPQHAKLN